MDCVRRHYKSTRRAKAGVEEDDLRGEAVTNIAYMARLFPAWLGGGLSCVEYVRPVLQESTRDAWTFRPKVRAAERVADCNTLKDMFGFRK